jgi:hypothetical protein
VLGKSVRKKGQALVAHTCNPSYSGGRDQEDHSLKPTQGNHLRDPISKIPNTKRAQGVGPEFKPQYCKKKERKKKPITKWGVVEWLQVIEYLPSKSEALSSNLSTAKINKQTSK